ncbi:MAG: PEP-CTERM sorting domain-containing protein [Vicinamibacterales bacterium]
MRRLLLGSALVLASLAISSPASASAITIDFESFGVIDAIDVPPAVGTLSNVGGSGVDVTFVDAIVVSSGAVGGALNEFDFPPSSGSNVAVADSLLDITFSALVYNVSAEFNYFLTQGTFLTFAAYDSSNALISSTTSAFSANGAVSGEIGSSPKELLSLLLPQGFSTLRISGDGQFTIDDLTFDPQAPGQTAPVPEPGTLLLVGGGAAALIRKRRQAKLQA